MPSMEHYEAARQWFRSEGEATLPASVASCLTVFFAMSDTNGHLRKSQNLLRELWLAMGLLPRSERRPRKKREPLPRDPAARKLVEIERLRGTLHQLTQQSQRQRDRLRKKGRAIKMTQNKINGLLAGDADETDEDSMTQEEREQAARENQKAVARIFLHAADEPDPRLARVDETLLSGCCVEIVDDVHPVYVRPESLAGTQVIQTRVESRTRYDFRLVMRRLDVPVEKKVVIDRHGERRMISASTCELGPPRFAVTWDFMVHVVILVILYAMPFHRLGRLLSTEEKRFRAAGLYKMTSYVANHCLPIVLQLFDELSDADILMGDDTSSRVLEVSRFFASGRADNEAPWSTWKTHKSSHARNDPKASSSLAERCAQEFGFCFPRRSGDGNKESFHTTVIAGKSNADDPRSLIVFYRSHLGSFGNLLEVLLQRRNPTHSKVIVQTDLSTTNLVKDPQVRERFSIQQVGCTAHARRPFARYEHEDPELAETMLSYFSHLAFLEKSLDTVGRNQHNVAAVRNVDAREVWEAILEAAQVITMKWSKETKLGEGARYILRHQMALQAYLDEPRLAPTNNLSERSLRMEKVIQNNSMFRASLEGRCAFDILRTLCQTANVAGVALNEYLLSILKTPADEISAHPEKYTPYAWAKAGGKMRPKGQNATIADLLRDEE